MKPGTAATEFIGENQETATRDKKPALPVLHLCQRLGKMVDRVCNGMRLIRAYNDLKRLNNHTLQDIGTRPGDLDRMLDGRWNQRS